MITKKNYIVLYTNGIVQIKKGEKISKIGKKIVIGWHGSYSPATGM